MAKPRSGEIRHFHSKVVGVSHKNDDGSSRQSHIKKCSLFESLLLDHEEDNAHDPNAVRVLRSNGRQLGYLDARLAEEIVKKSAKGYRFATLIKSITGGEGEKTLHGVNLLIVQASPGTSDGAVKNYLKGLMKEDPELSSMKLKRGCLGSALLALLALFSIGWLVTRQIIGG